jgi:hypothetical protein
VAQVARQGSGDPRAPSLPLRFCGQQRRLNCGRTVICERRARANGRLFQAITTPPGAAAVSEYSCCLRRFDTKPALDLEILSPFRILIFKNFGAASRPPMSAMARHLAPYPTRRSKATAMHRRGTRVEAGAEGRTGARDLERMPVHAPHGPPPLPPLPGNMCGRTDDRRLSAKPG